MFCFFLLLLDCKMLREILVIVYGVLVACTAQDDQGKNKKNKKKTNKPQETIRLFNIKISLLRINVLKLCIKSLFLEIKVFCVYVLGDVTSFSQYSTVLTIPKLQRQSFLSSCILNRSMYFQWTNSAWKDEKKLSLFTNWHIPIHGIITNIYFINPLQGGNNLWKKYSIET